MTVYLKAIKLAEDNNEKTTLGKLYNGLGICYYYMNNFEKTEFYIKKAAKAKLAVKDYTYYTLILSNLASLYIQNKQYDEAFTILLDAEKVLIKEKEERFLSHIYNSLGANYELAQPQSDSARYYYQKSLEIALKYNYEHSNDLITSVSSHNLGKLYFKQKKYSEALTFFGDALNYQKNQPASKYLEGIYASISQTYDSIGDYKNAYLYKAKQFDINQQIFNVENKKALEELEINYQTQKKEAQIQQQQKEIEQAKNQRNTIIFVAVVVFFMLLFGILLIFQRRKTKRLFEQEKLKLFENIVHEIKTPLTLINAPVKVLKNVVPPDMQENVQLIENNTQKLIRLTEELFDVSKLETGKYKQEYQIGNVDDFIQSILSGFSFEAISKEMQLVFFGSNVAEHFSYPSNALEKIISNLVGNAIKYNPKGTIITVKSIIENTIFSLEVRDNGIGIPKSEHKKITNRFYRGKNTSEISGTGIGLALVYDLVHLMNGKITFSSEENSGTIFLLTLPLQSIASVVTDNDKNSEKPLLLLAEDNREISQFVSSILSDSFEIISTFNGREAAEKISELIPDIVLTDVIMPEKDGIELLQSIKSDLLTEHVPVVVFSAKSSLENRLQGLKHGADAYIPKPFSPDELKLILKNLFTTTAKNRQEFQNSIQSEKTFEERMKSKDNYVNEIISLIVKNIEDPNYSVNELSSDMNISRSQLHRKLAALTGFSTTNFIRMIRLEKAKDLLLSNQGNITEIAYSCGFNSQSYFTKSFTEYFGKSPSNYLKQ